jgi:hypothetical protein
MSTCTKIVNMLGARHLANFIAHALWILNTNRWQLHPVVQDYYGICVWRDGWRWEHPEAWLMLGLLHGGLILPLTGDLSWVVLCYISIYVHWVPATFDSIFLLYMQFYVSSHHLDSCIWFAFGVNFYYFGLIPLLFNVPYIFIYFYN